MKQARFALSLAVLAVTAFLAATGKHFSAFALLFIAGNALAQASSRLCVTLTSTEILAQVIRAFAARIPMARNIGGEFRSATGLRLDKTYTAHIAALPTAEAVTTTYAVTGNNTESMLTDVDVTVSSRYGARLYWKNIDLIANDKAQFDTVINGAGYSLAKVFIDDLLTTAKAARFSQDSIFTTANSDADMLDNVTEDMNILGAGENRVMIVNSAVASTLNADSRITSNDFAGQRNGGNPFRRWDNVHGFGMVQEYPGLSLNNSAAVTGGAIEADDDIYTKTAHGYETGDRVILTSLTGGTGLTAANIYYFHKLSSSTGYLCSSLANAIAGTSVAVTLDASSVVLTGYENVTGFATDLTGINFLAGGEDHGSQDRLIASLGIQRVLNIETITEPESGITMSAVSYQDAATGDLTWMPVMLWGKVAGRKAGANAVGSYCDYGGHVLRSV